VESYWLGNENSSNLDNSAGAQMVQESTTWDLRYMTRTPSTVMEIYMLFLFLACIVTSVKLLESGDRQLLLDFLDR
jgi:hypothetical protein